MISHLKGDDWLLKYYNSFSEVIYLEGKSSNDIYQAYGTFEYLVADRGHAQMIGYAMGCKTAVPVSYDKLRWFYEDIGLADYAFDEADENLAEKIFKALIEINDFQWQAKREQILTMAAEQEKNIFEELERNLS